MLDLEILFARYSFEVAMLARCLDATRPLAPYAERAHHFLGQILAQVREAADLDAEDPASLLGEMLAFDPDLALAQLEHHLALHRRCLHQLERACLDAEPLAESFGLMGPACLETVAGSHRRLDEAQAVLWAARTYGLAG